MMISSVEDLVTMTKKDVDFVKFTGKYVPVSFLVK